MSDQSTGGPGPLPVQESSSPKWSTTMKFKALAGVAIGASVLALEVLGYAPKGTYIMLVAAPGLAALGLHKAS